MIDPGPDEVLAEFWRWWKVLLTGLALIAVLIVGGWRAHWWFAQQNVSRQGRIIQNGYANQAALRQQVTDGIAAVQAITVQLDTASGQQAADLKAQRLALAGDACYHASQVNPATPLPAPQAHWVHVNCSAGIVSPGSPLRK